MSFAGEMNDFMKAYQTGSEIRLNIANRQKVESNTIAKPSTAPTDATQISSPLSQGGEGGGVGTTTAPQVKSGAVTGGEAPAAGSFAQTAYKHFRDKGLSHAHAAGIVGNLMVESAGGDPQVLNGVRKGDQGTAWYAAQWRGPRLNNLLAFAKSRHPDSPQPTIDDQLDFVLEEGNEKSPYADSGAVQAFKLGSQAQTADQATDAYMTHFERPRDRSSFGSRTKYATSLADSGGGAVAAPAVSQPAIAEPGTDDGTIAPVNPDQQADQAADTNPQIDVATVQQQAPQVAPQVADDPRFTGLYAQGGAIPDDTQHFQEGGVSDPYNPNRGYTQPIPQTAPAAVPRRISFPVAAGSGTGAAPSTDWRNWGEGSPAQLKLRQALAAKPAIPEPAPAPAPAAPAPVKRGNPVGQMIYAPGGGGSGQQQWFQVAPPQYKVKAKQPVQPQATQFAAGGAVTDRNSKFQELLRQETRQRPTSVGDHEGGESARDRAARRLSAQEKRPSSTAYRPAKAGGGQGRQRFPAAPKANVPTPTPRPGDVTGGRQVQGPPASAKLGPQQGPPMSARPAAARTGPASAGEIINEAAEALPFKQTLDQWGRDIYDWMGQGAATPADTPMSSGDPMGAPQVSAYAQGGAIPDDRFEPRSRNVGRNVEQGATYRPRPTQTKTSKKQKPKSTTKPQQRQGRKTYKRTPANAPTPTPRPGTEAAVPTPTPRPDRGGPILARPEGPVSDNRAAPPSTFPARPGVAGGNGPNAPPPMAPRNRSDLNNFRQSESQRAADFSVGQQARVPAQGPPLSARTPQPLNSRDRPMPTGGGPPLASQAAKAGPSISEIVQSYLPSGRDLAWPFRTQEPESQYAQGGAIPDPEDPTQAEGAPAPSAAGYNEAVAEGRTASQPAADTNPGEVIRSGAADAVKVGLSGLQRIFGLAPQGAMPTPEDAANHDQGTQRFASGEGAATPEEVQAIDKTMGIDKIPVDEGMKNLIRIDQTVQYYLQNGDKDKAEAVAASLLQYGARRVGQYGTMAQAAFEHYQQSGDPQDLKNASLAIQKAHQMVPDGFNIKIDVDPKTRQIVATTLGPDGKQQQQVVDPMAIPGLLKGAMDGSEYWSSVFQVGQPNLAGRQATAAATQQNADLAGQRKRQEFDYEQQVREGYKQAGENRGAARKLWEEDRSLEVGKTENERQRNANQAYFDDWSQRMSEAQDPAQKQQLTQEGLGYRYDHAPDRKTAVAEEDLRFGTSSAYGETFDEADVPAIRNIARSIALKNGKLDSVSAMEAAGALITDAAPAPAADGTLEFGNGAWSLVFNPALLPQLSGLRKKYRTQQ